MTKFDRGDHIRVWRPVPGFWHHGICVGNSELIHYSGEVARKTNASICRVGEAEFLHGSNGEVVPHDHALPPDEVVRQGESRLGERGYNLAFNNCEHFANWCKDGDARCEQVRRVPVAIVAGRAAARLAGTAASFAATLVAVPVISVVVAPVAATWAARETWKWISKKGR